jgi:8-oxo-dGTP pyrophosphatase MutT (NUDIX family)
VLAPDAATVVLARDAGEVTDTVEVLLLERHAGSRMAPGAFAFPGGRVEPDDTSPDAERLCRGLTGAAAARILHDVRPAGRAIGFWIAALRELFEETGLLLACDGSGAPFGSGEAGRARLQQCRARCRSGDGVFRTMLLDEGLRLATDRMVYYAHWITPEERPVRYDTRFFVAAAFPDGSPEPDGIEVVAARWLTPAAAVAAHQEGALSLPFVTQRVLRSVGRYPTVAALLEAARSREVRPIRPRIVLAGGQERLLLPGDPGYF